MNKEKNFISAVVYVHNAADRIEKFLNMLISVLENNFEHSEIVCVNDASDDDSVKKIKAICEDVRNTSISVINMSYYHGLELAMNAGNDMAIGDFVFEFDTTDVDYEESLIMDIYRRSLEGYDIVSASPNKKQKFSSSAFYYLFDRFAKLPYKMTTESFRILSRRVINRISSMNKTIPYRKAVYSNSGLKTDHIVYEITEQVTNHDKVEKKYRERLAVDSLILFTDLGYTFSIWMTALMMVLAIGMIVYSVVIYVTGTPVEGWTTTILFLSIAFLGLFGILTIIMKYLQLIIDLIFRRKRYSFEGIEKITK